VSEFKTFLKAWLKGHGWSVIRLAQEAQISDRVIYHWLREDAPKRPSDANLKKLAPALGVSEFELLRMAGYFSEGDKPSAERQDPRLAKLNARWFRLPEGVRESIDILSNASFRGLTLSYLGSLLATP
jgi:transcriptional regulator with XRE-family HTH domain